MLQFVQCRKRSKQVVALQIEYHQFGTQLTDKLNQCLPLLGRYSQLGRWLEIMAGCALVSCLVMYPQPFPCRYIPT